MKLTGREKKNQRDACLEITFTVILKRRTFFSFGGNQRRFELRLVCVVGGACSVLTPASSSTHLFSLSLLFFQIHIIDFDDENNIINKNVLLHQAGEIWHIGASPADKAVLTTCYNKSESYCFLLSLAPFTASLCIRFLCLFFSLFSASTLSICSFLFLFVSSI